MQVGQIGYMFFAGIVRGFDTVTDELYITTPVDKERLIEVKTIRASSTIKLPEVVFRSQTSFSNVPVPFLTFKESDRFNQTTKKSTSRLNRVN